MIFFFLVGHFEVVIVGGGGIELLKKAIVKVNSC